MSWCQENKNVDILRVTNRFIEFMATLQGTGSSGQEQRGSRTLALKIFCQKASADASFSLIVQTISGQDLHGETPPLLNVDIVFDSTPIPVCITFQNGTRWNVFLVQRALQKDDYVDWTKFFVFADARPKDVSARIESFTSDELVLVLTAKGPQLFSPESDEITDSVMVRVVFMPSRQ